MQHENIDTYSMLEKKSEDIEGVLYPFENFIRISPGVYHFPSLELISVFSLNIIVSIVVNIISNKLYERYFSGRRELYSNDQLKEIINTEVDKNYTITKIDNESKESIEINVRKSLSLYGMPSSKTEDISKDIIRIFFQDWV